MIRPLPLVLAAVVAVSGCSSGAPTAPPPAPGTSAPASGAATGGDAPATPASASPVPAAVPAGSVTAADQPVREGAVTVGASADVPAFVVLHRDLDGAPGEILAHAPVEPGGDQPVVVPLEASAVGAGDVLWAMLHVDAGETGTYEFPGPDVPLRDASGAVVMTPFEITDED